MVDTSIWYTASEFQLKEIDRGIAAAFVGMCLFASLLRIHSVWCTLRRKKPDDCTEVTTLYGG